MLRTSFAAISRTAARSAASSSSSTSAAAAAALPRLTSLGRRHYSEEATASEGAEAASSANPEQQKEQAKKGAAGKGKQAEAGAAGQSSEQLAKELEKAKKDFAEMKNNYLLSRADFENLQKITLREKKIAKAYAIESFARDIISNMDILHLALKHVPAERRTKPSSSTESDDPAVQLVDLFTGVDMTAKNLEKTLERFDVKPFDPTGEKFNPNLHEAIYQAPVPGKEPGSVLECQKKGWMLKDRVIRAAQVGVVMDQ